jgi:hypothetical protein
LIPLALIWISIKPTWKVYRSFIWEEEQLVNLLHNGSEFASKKEEEKWRESALIHYNFHNIRFVKFCYESLFFCLTPINKWSNNTLQTLISNQIKKECRKLKYTRYLVMKGKPFEELFEKKTLWDNQTQDRLFFLLAWTITTKVSLNTTLCVYTTLLDEKVNQVMSPITIACQYIWRSSNNCHPNWNLQLQTVHTGTPSRSL